jgi:hypothetical protein
MATLSKTSAARRAEFGDFQTPFDLASSVCGLLANRGVAPTSILEPTCGKGSFLLAALDRFPTARRAIGLDINAEYVAGVRAALPLRTPAGCVADVRTEDFFDAGWSRILLELPDPLLVIGNPPWVTNAALGALRSSNLPEKSNFQKHTGFDAMTGKSNFDISEWMLIRIVEGLQGRRATLAVLCKTAVARKVLDHVWKNGLSIAKADVYLIDALKHFEATVDACLLVCVSEPAAPITYDCAVHTGLSDIGETSTFGYRDSRIVADTAAYEHAKHLVGQELYKWRSGVKHDCSSVMELYQEESGFRNGLGELVELEDDYLYPMLKSSEVANGETRRPSRWMIVTQRSIGEDTSVIAERAPKTWRYLQNHSESLGRRASSIYRNRPPFSIFGVGDYSFAQWKVAISGFYKNLKFAVVGPRSEKPVIVDDTVYFIACQSREEATYLCALLNSEIAHDFLKAFCFLDAKRPITTDLLRRLDLLAVAREVGSEETLRGYVSPVVVTPQRKRRDRPARVLPLRNQNLLFDCG